MNVRIQRSENDIAVFLGVSDFNVAGDDVHIWPPRDCGPDITVRGTLLAGVDHTVYNEAGLDEIVQDYKTGEQYDLTVFESEWFPRLHRYVDQSVRAENTQQ